MTLPQLEPPVTTCWRDLKARAFLQMSSASSALQRRIDNGEPLFARLERYAGGAEQRAELSSGTFIGPGDGAVPGAGCGNAVERAVWKVTLPSTFCIT